MISLCKYDFCCSPFLTRILLTLIPICWNSVQLPRLISNSASFKNLCDNNFYYPCKSFRNSISSYLLIYLSFLYHFLLHNHMYMCYIISVLRGRKYISCLYYATVSSRMIHIEHIQKSCSVNVCWIVRNLQFCWGQFSNCYGIERIDAIILHPKHAKFKLTTRFPFSLSCHLLGLLIFLMWSYGRYFNMWMNISITFV